MIRDQARQTASADHSCPVDRVQVSSDASIGNDYAYWLDVCGQRRFYRYQQTSTSGLGSGRFLDDTQRTASSVGAQ